MSSKFEHGGTIFAVARQLGVLPEALLDFSASINPLGPAPGVRDALTAAYDRLVHYPDSSSATLREALAACHGFTPQQICVANGSTELIHLIPRMQRFRIKRALLLVPSFSEYARSLELSGWSVDPLVMSAADGFKLDITKIEKALYRKYDLLFLCNPGNPTGRLYTRHEIGRLLELCRQAGTLFVHDEAFMDFCEEESAKQFLDEDGSLLILRSMTKFYGFPGLRLGYALGSPTLITELERLRPPWSVGLLAQAAGLAALADTNYARMTRELVAVERQRLSTALQGGGVKVFGGVANYLLVEILTGLTATELQHRLMERGILIRNCCNFAGLDERFFRVAVRSGRENDRLLQALHSSM